MTLKKLSKRSASIISISLALIFMLKPNSFTNHYLFMLIDLLCENFEQNYSKQTKKVQASIIWKPLTLCSMAEMGILFSAPKKKKKCI